MKYSLLTPLLWACLAMGGHAEILKGGGGLPVKSPLLDYYTSMDAQGGVHLYSPEDIYAGSQLSLGAMFMKADTPALYQAVTSSSNSNVDFEALDAYIKAATPISTGSAYLATEKQNAKASLVNEGALTYQQTGEEQGWFSKFMSDPVDTVSGSFLVDETDISLNGAFPLKIRRNYSSQSGDIGQFGYSWKSSMVPYLVEKTGGDKVILAAEMDGSVVEYVQTGSATSTVYAATEPYTVNGTTTSSNRHLANCSTSGLGGLGNLFRQTINISSSIVDPDPVGAGTNVRTTQYVLSGSDGSVRYYYTRKFPLSTTLDRSRPYLYQWVDNCGNYLTFHYGEDVSRWDYGQLNQIRSSNGAFLNFEYDSQGHIVRAATNDGRRLEYFYNASGDLTSVTLPDNSTVEYDYELSDKNPTTGVTVEWYSTHLLHEVRKPDGRVLRNEYDKRRRVTKQWATAGKGLELVRNATFVYGTGSVVDDGSDTHPRKTDNLTGWTRVYDFRNEPSTQPQNDVPNGGVYDPFASSQPLGHKHYLYEYQDGLATRNVSPLGQESLCEWYADRNTYPDPAAAIGANGLISGNGAANPAATSPGGYPRSPKRRVDARGLVSYFWYDAAGNELLKKMKGDITGLGVGETQVFTSKYNSRNQPSEVSSVAYQADGNTVMIKDSVEYNDGNYPYLPTAKVHAIDTVEQSRNALTYTFAGDTTATALPHNRPVFAKGLLQTSQVAAGSAESSSSRFFYDNRGFLNRTLKFGDVGLSVIPQVVNSVDDEDTSFVYNYRGQVVTTTDRSGTVATSEYDPIGRPTISQIRDSTGNLLSNSATYYNANGEISWVDGPRSGAEDYVLKDYDASGRVISEIVWRSEADAASGGVSSVGTQDWFIGQSVTRYEYDCAGNCTKIIDPRGNESAMVYDEGDRLVAKVSYQGAEGGSILACETRTYTANGDLLSVTKRPGLASPGLTTIFSYNALGQQLKVTGADGTVSSCSYYPDGQIKSKTTVDSSGYVANQSLYIYAYNFVDEGQNHTRVTTVITAAGVAQGQQESILDRRGNLVASVDLDGFKAQATYDGMDRKIGASGPPGQSGYSVSQTASISYSLVDRTTTTTDALGYFQVATKDPLGRASKIRYSNPGSTDERISSFEYGGDFQSVTEISGVPGSSDSTKSVTFSDVSGRPVLMKKYRTEGDYDLSTIYYDENGNPTSSTDEVGLTTRMDYDGLNRPVGARYPDGGETHNVYDWMGDITDRYMPRDLHFQATFDSLGRIESQKLIGRDGGVSRHLYYSYFPDGAFKGQLHYQIDVLRNVTTEYAEYDAFLRPKTVRHRSGLNNVIGVDQAFSYDKRGNLLSEKETHVSGSHPATQVGRLYDGYSKPYQETVSKGAPLTQHSLFQQRWDARGRRTHLIPDGGQTYTFQYDPQGRVKEVGYGVDAGYGSAFNKSYRAVIERAKDGSIQTCSSPWLQTKVLSRDRRGETLSEQSMLGNGSGPGVYTGGYTGQIYVENFSYRGDRRLASRTLERTGLTDRADYDYDAGGRLVDWKFKRSSSPTQDVFAKEFGLSYDADHLGALTKRDILRNEQDQAHWEIPGGRLDQYGRVLTQQTDGISGFLAQGSLNLMAKVDLDVTHVTSGKKYRYENVPVKSTLAQDGNYVWQTELSLPSGPYHMEALATHPSGAATSKAISDFTVGANSIKTTEIAYDASGFPSTRTLPDGRVQSLTWDVLGRLLSVSELSGNNGYTWTATYDPLGRRIATNYKAAGSGPASGSAQTNLSSLSYFDPSYEFLELGASWSGISASGTTVSRSTLWKLYGPDQSGDYGNYNGTGGLLGVIAGPGESTGYLTDHLGDIVGTVMPNGSGGLRCDLAGFADPFGPARDHVFPGPTTIQSMSDPDPLCAGWKSRSLDPTGLVWIGKRYYDPASARFVSPDPAGHDGSWDLYMYAKGDPINYLDHDGRLAMGVASGATDSVPAGAPDTSTFWWAYQLTSLGIAGNEGGTGGVNVMANEITFGGSDKIGLTDSSKYQGSDYVVSRVSGVIVREGTITLATMGAGNLVAAGRGANYARTAYLTGEGYSAYRTGESATNAYYNFEDGNYVGGALNTLGAVAGVVGVGGTFAPAIRADAQALNASTQTWQDFLPQAQEILAGVKAQYGGIEAFNMASSEAKAGSGWVNSGTVRDAEIIIDENLSPALESLLQNRGYYAYALPKGLKDPEIILYAQQRGAIVLTNNWADFVGQGVGVLKVPSSLQTKSAISLLMDGIDAVQGLKAQSVIKIK